MKKQIERNLQLIEKQYNIRVLMACESGSRAWGFPSPDSDYDVRFVYCHPREWYLSLDEPKDTIEHMEGELDLVGWDLRKSLRLLRKSNAALLEQMQSPILYMEVPGFRESMLNLAPDYFSPRAALYHYLSMAGKYYELCGAAAEARLKDYFYLLRTSLASLWVVEKQTIPPLQLQQLLPLVMDADLREKILVLVELKAGVGEQYLYSGDPKLSSYVQEVVGYCKTRAAELQKEEGPTEPLNNFFRKTVEKVWH